MSTKSRERKKIVRNTLSKINESFYSEAKLFIADVFAIENKTVPNFIKMSGDEILHLYGTTCRSLIREQLQP